MFSLGFDFVFDASAFDECVIVDSGFRVGFLVLVVAVDLRVGVVQGGLFVIPLLWLGCYEFVG